MSTHVNGFYQTRLMRQTDAERIATALSTQEGILRAEAVPARHIDSACDWYVLVIPAGPTLIGNCLPFSINDGARAR